MIDKLYELIEEKKSMSKLYVDAVREQYRVELDYTMKGDNVKLNPDRVQSEMELSKKPTEKQVQAFIELEYHLELEAVNKAKIKVLQYRKQLEVLDDLISHCKYALRREENL